MLYKTKLYILWYTPHAFSSIVILVRNIMLKRMLVVAALFTTGAACAQMRINATCGEVKKTSEVDDHNKVALEFEKFLLYVQVETPETNRVKMHIDINPVNQEGSHAAIEREAALNEEVTIDCPQTGASITLTAEEAN